MDLLVITRVSLQQQTHSDTVDRSVEIKRSSIRTRNMVESPLLYNKMPRLPSIPEDLKMNYDVLIGKPYFLTTRSWSGQAAYTTVFSLDVPSDIRPGTTVVPWEASSRYRSHLCCYLQVAGTPQHMGTLIAAAVPVGAAESSLTNFNSLLQAPHVFLSANEATPVCLEVPFYSNAKLLNTNVTNLTGTTLLTQNYAQILVMVVNPLSGPASSSTSLSISVHVEWVNAEFYVPTSNRIIWNNPPGFVAESAIVSNVADSVAKGTKFLMNDLIDRLRGTFRMYTGMHNPNVSAIQHRIIQTTRNFANVVDVPTQFEKLDPYVTHDRVTEDYTFHTDRDEMLVSHTISKPQFLSTVAVTSSIAANSVIFSRPITPFQEKLDKTTNPAATTSLYINGLMSRYWRGPLRLHIQSVMTSFHYVKLGIFRYYSRDTRTLTQVPHISDVGNMMVDTVEFSAGGQVQTIELPYCGETDELPCNPVAKYNALQHGMYYVSMMQPLVVTGTVPTTVYFNMYISAGPDFTFYGYGVNLMTTSTITPTSFVAESVLVEPSDQSAIDSKPTLPTSVYVSKFQPIVSMRDHIRRHNMNSTVSLSDFTGTAGVYIFPVSRLMVGSANRFVGPAKIARYFFLGLSGGFKMKIFINGVNDAIVKYVPPQVNHALHPENAVVGASNISTVANGIITHLRYPDVAGSSNVTGDDRYPIPYTAMTPAHHNQYSVAVAEDTVTFGVNSRTLEFDITVPQMNYYEFVGTNGYVRNDTLGGALDDLGSIVVSLTSILATGDQQELMTPTITFSPAYSDEVRMGFQVYSPVVAPYIVEDTSVVPSIWYWGSLYQDHNDAPLEFEYLDSAPAAYIG